MLKETAILTDEQKDMLQAWIAERNDPLDNPWYMTDERGIPLSYAEAVVTMFELAEEHRCANLNTDSTRI